MAELPRYRRDSLLGVVVSDIPTAGLQESARASETFSNAMDRVSQFAFKIAEKKAKIDGAEFGASNAPTSQQLELAKKSGQDLEAMLPGDQFSVFGSNARAAALDILTTNMEKEARESITAFSANYENKKITLADLQMGLVTIEDQYSALLQDISPAAAVKFRADIALAGNSAFLSASKTEAARMKADQESVAIALVKSQIASIPDVINAGQTVNANGETITSEEFIDVLKGGILNAGLQVDNQNFVKNNLAAVETAVKEARQATVIASVRFNPEVGIRALQGKQSLPEVEAQQILETMNPSEKNALFDKLQSEISEKLSAEEREENRLTQTLEKKADETIVAMTAARLEGDMETVKLYLDELSAYNADKYASYAEAIFIQGGADNEETFERLELLALNFNLTEDDVNKARADGKLGLKSYTKFLDKVKANRNETYRSAVSFVKRQIGYPDTPLSNPGKIDRQALQEVNEIVDQLFLKRQEIPDEDALAFVKPLLKDVADRRRDAKARKKAMSAYNRAAAEYKGLSVDALLNKYEGIENPSPRDKSIIEGLKLYIEIEGDLQ